MTEKKRDILHIVAGDPESGWDPSIEDMEQIRELFLHATVDENNPAVVVTRTGITAKVVSIYEGDEIKVTRAEVTQADLPGHIDSTKTQADKAGTQENLQ